MSVEAWSCLPKDSAAAAAAGVGSEKVQLIELKSAKLPCLVECIPLLPSLYMVRLQCGRCGGVAVSKFTVLSEPALSCFQSKALNPGPLHQLLLLLSTQEQATISGRLQSSLLAQLLCSSCTWPAQQGQLPRLPAHAALLRSNRSLLVISFVCCVVSAPVLHVSIALR